MEETETGFYVVATGSDGREFRLATLSDRAYAITFATVLRDADERLRRVDVCRQGSGLIIKGWDRSDRTGRWVRSI